MKSLLLTLSFLFIASPGAYNQTVIHFFKGTVTDIDNRIPLSGANVLILYTSPPQGTITDSSGVFRLPLAIGRYSVKISFLGYEDLLLNNIQIASGKELDLNIALREKVIRTSDVVVRAEKAGRGSINPMATLSTNTIRTDDALRYAGGFYDPSRIVNAFAGVVTANSDESNDIVIRGNSSRGLLWRLEGIEIPNPNHFSDGQGGSGGAFSAITSNVIDNFDFFTGAFPAEFGNAFSGVMDLNLRKGNSDKYEFAFQTGMIGAELASEGPFSQKSRASYLLNARYTNFGYLADLGIIDLGSTNIAPETKDITLNINLPSGKAGTFSIFGMAGASKLGKEAVSDSSQWETPDDSWEELEKQSSLIIGLKHLFILPDKKTYTRLILAYTSYNSSLSEGYLDSAYNSHSTYSYSYLYPSFRSSLMANHKLNNRNTIRGGLNYNYMEAAMKNLRENSSGSYDSLVLPYSDGNQLQAYIQWKFRAASDLEINSGMHFLNYTLTGQKSLEPRLGFRWNIKPEYAFTMGIGFHSRTESMAVYNALVKNPKGVRDAFNNDLGLSKAFHFVTGVDLFFRNEVRFKLEYYIQQLYNIPIVNRVASQYSTLNSAERLPDVPLENEGSGRNNGLELTIEKAFTRNYYFLVTGSVFNSSYIAGDNRKYNTYYNTRFVTNLVAGRDFYVGRGKRNSIGINAKYLWRGGYRYTPVDVESTIRYKRLIYKTSETYEAQLPDFMRLDAGISFRNNNPKYSWMVMLDVQNLTDRENVFRKRFSYSNGKIVSTDVVSLGMVPIFNFRVEF
jgi:hypothetical protein